jgi:hypothetical protein
MPKLQIRHQPDLTKERFLEILQKQFQGKYEVYHTKVIDRDVCIKQSSMSGVFLKLKQKDDRTEIVYNRNAPSAVWRGLLGIWPYLFAGRPLEREVKQYLESAQEFK